MTTCYLQTSLPQLYEARTEYSDYDMQIFSESNLQVSGQTAVKLRLAVKVVSNLSNLPFMIIPDPSMYNTPVRFTGSPVYINQDGYYNVTLYLVNTSPYTYTFGYGKPLARITLLNEKFNLVTEPYSL